MKLTTAAVAGSFVGAGLGLVCGVIYAFGGLIIDLFTIGLNRGTLMAFGALIGMPLIFGAAGLALGIVVWAIARALGGFRD